jgi:hypothetical protein
MPESEHDTPLALVLPLGVLAVVHALALALGSGSAAGPGPAFGAWGQVNITAALLSVVAFALILRRHREAKRRPDPVTLAWAVAAADLAAMVVAAALLRPWA